MIKNTHQIKIVVFLFLFISLCIPSNIFAEDANAYPIKIQKIEVILPKDKQVLEKGDTFTVRAKITDSVATITSCNVSFYLDIPEYWGNLIFVDLQETNDPDIYEGTYTLKEDKPYGMWKLHYISIYDSAYNSHDSSLIEWVDLKRNSLPIGFNFIDYDGVYDHNVTPVFIGEGKLDGKRFTSGTTIDRDGNYQLVITNPLGKEVTVPFLVDKTPPIISGVKEGMIYNQPVTLTYNEGLGYLQTQRFNYKWSSHGYGYMQTGYEATENAKYSLVVTNKTGAQTIVSFTIDMIIPSLNLTSQNTNWTNKDVKVSIEAVDKETGLAELIGPDGKKIPTNQKTYEIKKNGVYTFSAKDIAGNKIEKYIRIKNIDKTAPIMTIDGSTLMPTNKDLTLFIYTKDKESGIKYIHLPNGKKGEASLKSYKITKNGTYTFAAEDSAGNKTTQKIKITNIDKEVPKQPKVNKVTTNSIIVSGYAEKGTTVFLYKGSKRLGSMVADAKGYYIIKIPKQKKNTVLTVFTKDNANNKSKSAKVKVQPFK
ncbi:Ig-like domain-containing protein [Niallia sp. JL1B1071]|uniref:Ig-like domain-containing protein n=1 Tax=Niallia tiangongensis TaxID=3237105 RepID=UPI0037DCA73B